MATELRVLGPSTSLAHGSMQGDRVSNEMTFTGALSLKVYLIMKSVGYKIQTSLEDT